MSTQALYYIMGISGGLFLALIVAYVFIKNSLGKSDLKRIKQLREGTTENKFSSDVIYQKLYVFFAAVPLLKRYVRKLRRKLEVIAIDDEYLIRKQTAKTILESTLLIGAFTVGIVLLARQNPLLLSILLLFEAFLIEAIMSGKIDKLDTKLLKQQVNFFAEIRHAYHEYNMVEEAIYEVSQDDKFEISRQGERIYEILISDDPETELEKYYDVAPNSYLKEFAGVSYLTREFGDRYDSNGASLYLKNLNNITEEMQLEILKREKLDYVFQSLSFIAVAPVLLMEPLKQWSISNFSFTSAFYEGKGGFIVQMILVFLTFISYILVRKIKDNSSIKPAYKDPNKVWQMKLYNKIGIVRLIANSFIPKEKTKQYRKDTNLIKDSAAKQKIETFYINRILAFVGVFIVTLSFFMRIHTVSIKYIYENEKADYDMLGEMTDSEKTKAREQLEKDNYFLNKYKNTKLKGETLKASLAYDIKTSIQYRELREEELEKTTERIYKKIMVVNKEYLSWVEWLFAFVFGIVGYYAPMLLLIFQKYMRKLEIEGEVMQFQTIILMLMKIERVNVEMILEWLERYSNIFREPITKCVNNYEAGAWEALEEMKTEINFDQMLRIIEGLQSAVEKIPIQDAFDELDNEREYYQAKRKESNERLIKRKGMIGKIIGFAPLVCLFVGYLIVPLVAIGLTSMSSTFSTMQTTTAM